MTEAIVKIKGRDFLTKDAAVAALREEYPIPHSAITCTVIDLVTLCIRAEIYVDGVLIASAHAWPKDSKDDPRKVEGAAVARALRLAGYSADTYENEGASQDMIQRGGKNLNQRENRRIPAPKDGEKRVFMVDAIRSLMNEHGLYYRLHTTDNTEIFAFSRDFGREWGYADTTLDKWKESGFVAKWEKPLPVTAVYKEDTSWGGSWRWMAKESNKSE